uniref:Uncharacterized protein n=1 Tax=Opuntia streptacantha TaxID=393608 RepID=A0A7C9EAU0_OPUST
MLSPLLLNSPKAEARETDPSLSEGVEESFRERNGSNSLSLEVLVDVDGEEEGDWFRLRFAIFAEGGTGIKGIGRVCLGLRGLGNLFESSFGVAAGGGND